MSNIINFVKRDYSKFHLQRNPFSYTPIPQEEPEIFIGQDNVIKKIGNIISTSYSTSNSSHVVLIGFYGSGKSHVLKYLKKLIKNLNINNENKIQVCYISSLGHNFLHLYREFLEQIGYKTIISLIKQHKEVNDYNISIIYESLLNEKTSIYAWRWILGEKLETSTRNIMGVSRNIDEILALSIFQDVIKMLIKNNINLTCLLIDELETINELQPYQRQALFNNLRRLIDDNPRGVVSIFACTPVGWDEIIGRSIALTRRVSGNVLYMNRLNQEDTRKVIKEHLKYYRDNTTSFENKSEIYPFTEDSIIEIYQRSDGNIGELVKYCNQIIDLSIDDNLALISASDIKKYLT